jgi:hypothetical protein
MNPSPRIDTQIISYAFFSTLALTLIIYILRGFRVSVFTSIPGGVILFLILLSIGTGIAYSIQKTRRY